MSRVFWDTNIFIYFFENHGEQGNSARGLRERMLRRGDQLITSAMTVGEILVKPRQRQDLDRCTGDHRNGARPSVRPGRRETILRAAP
jgi:predicted nucleic acid-binding protein